MPGVTALAIRSLPSEERDSVAELWTGLEARLGSTALSCSWDWTGTWLAQWGDVVPHRFLVGEADGDVRGIVLVTHAAARPLRQRTWHLGTAGEPRGEGVFVERNRLLAADGERAAFAAALVGALREEGGWDRLCLDGLHADDAAALLAAAPGARARVEQSPVADLGGGEDVLDALSSSRRQRIRRTLRAFGELACDWAESPAQAEEILGELIDLHQARWREDGAPGAFVSPRFTAFHRALIATLLPQGRAALVRVRREGETVGCLYGLVEDGRLLFYQGGLRRYEDNRLKAGVAAHVAFMRACRARGLAEYDFLAPAARYKEELATRADALTWAELDRATPRTALARVVRAVRRER
jgi:CelD/BcsL family acetyltransferase involved in cellulose biosynthesis